MDTAERYRQIRQKLPLAQGVDVARERESLSLPVDLVDWINDNSQAGGWFRSHGDAVERALARLRTERAFIEGECRSRKVPFKADAFWKLYAAELRSTAPSGRRRADTDSEPRVLVFATIAVELVDWANATWLDGGPVKRLADVAEVGLRRLRAGGHRLDPDAEEPKLTLPGDRLWRLYEAAAKS